MWNVKCVWVVMRGECSCLTQICRTQHWQNHVKYILATSASLQLCYERWTTKMFFDVNNPIPRSNPSIVLPITLCYFHCVHFDTCTIYYRKSDVYIIVFTKQLCFKTKLCNTDAVHVCRPTLQHMILQSWVKSIYFSMWHFNARYIS